MTRGARRARALFAHEPLSGAHAAEPVGLAALPVWMIRWILSHRRAILVGLHVMLVPIVYATAFSLRFDSQVPPAYIHAFWVTMPLLLVLRLSVFAGFRQYNGWWRHVGLYDLTQLLKAVTVSSLLFGLVTIVGHAFGWIPGVALPRSVLLLDWGTSILCFGGVRFGVRWLREREVTGSWPRGGRRTLIIGADSTADRLLRQVRLDSDSGIHPVGLVDDNFDKRGMQIHGVPVLGRLADLRSLVVQHRVELLVVAMTAASREQMTQIMQYCAGLGVEFKIVPSLRELIDGTTRLSQIRAVRIEDLLGRMPVTTDLGPVDADLEGRVVAITGGAGSIGSELARQVCRSKPRRVLLLEQAESPLYFVHLELQERHPELDIVPVMVDVANHRQLERVFEQHRPDYVLHAAAYKHVPMMEANVAEAVRNNVIGTWAVAECAVRYGAEKVVMISTDKAVNPSSVMGATKRAAERLVLEWPDFQRSATDFRVVRFGNVLGSNGSVIPLFKQQIAAGGPLTVTHPETTRYFMTIPEAVQLVLQAASLPETQGSIAMLEMGAPVRILEMAEHLVRLSGLEPYADIPIVFTGLRPGEKLHEELTPRFVATVPTSIDKIHMLQGTSAGGLGGHGAADSRVSVSPTIEMALVALESAIETNDLVELFAALRALVPEWTVRASDGNVSRSAYEMQQESAPSLLSSPRRNGYVHDRPVPSGQVILANSLEPYRQTGTRMPTHSLEHEHAPPL